MAGIAHLISTHRRIPTAFTTDVLGSVLENVRSSHDPIFVMEDGVIAGVISVSHALYKRRYPLSTKVHRAMRRAPRITPSTDIYTVARRILSSEIYTLPVIEGKKVVGVISAKKILRNILKDNTTLNFLSDGVEVDSPFTFDGNTKIRDVYSSLKRDKTSRILVVDSEGKLVGIATRRDIQDGLWPPTRKQRFGKNRWPGARSIAFDEEKIKRLDYPIHEFMKTSVVTAEVKESLREMLSRMLDESVNSIVIVDRNNRPKGIITMRSVLKTLSGLKPQEGVTIELSDKHQVLVEREKEFVVDELRRFAQKLQKQDKIRHIEIAVSAYHNITGKVTGFEIHLRVHMMSGDGAMTQVEDKKLSNALHEAIRKVKQQLAHRTSFT